MLVWHSDAQSRQILIHANEKQSLDQSFIQGIAIFSKLEVISVQ